MSTAEDQQAFLAALIELGRPTFAPLHFVNEGLTKGEFYMLNLIYDHTRQSPGAKGMYVSELAEQLHVTPPAVSRMLRGMESKGCLERVVDRSDRRTTYIVLKPRGAAMRHSIEQRALAFSGRIIDRMGAADIATLLELWTRLKHIAHEELAKERSHTCSNCSNTSNSPL